MSQTAIQPQPVPAEQFDDPHQQHHAATLGMWTFLATEVLFFGVIFLGFYAMRLRWPADFADGARELKWYLGGLNTAILLTSSYFMAIAVHAAQEGNSKSLSRWLIATFSLGLLFLLVKFTEYGIEYHDRLLPFWHYSATTPDTHALRPQRLPLFMSAYFIATAFHGLHVIIGLCTIATLWVMNRHGRFTTRYNTPVEMVGLYWHFVDIVWVFLFPTLYLLRHG